MRSLSECLAGKSMSCRKAPSGIRSAGTAFLQPGTSCMRLEATDAARLWDMLHEAREIHGLVQRLDFQTYLADEASGYLIDRRLEVIAEASKRISKTFKDSHTDIPW